MDRVGVIGLGLLGNALAERFARGGLPVVGFDVREECRRNMTALGAAADSAAAVATSAAVIVLSLPNSDVVADVIGQIESALPGKLVMDTTTGDPERTAALGARLKAKGIGYVDATVAGSSAQARAGEVVVMAGGGAEDVGRCEGLFRLFAKRWFHVGPWGSGARMKLVVNLVLGLNRAVLAEGLALARGMGLDLTTTLEILTSGPAYSRAMDAKGRKMIEGDFAAEAKLAQHLKDVRLILEAGGRAGVDLPLSGLHETLLAHLEEIGLGECDNSAIIRAYE